jgi:L-aspartate oxidase
MVIAARVVEAIERGKVTDDGTGAMRAVHGDAGRAIDAPAPLKARAPSDVAKERDQLQRAMTTNAGVLRNAESLAAAATALDAIGSPTGDDQAAAELRNLVTVGQALVTAATARHESRGAHTRTDFAHTDPAWAVRLVLQ